MSIHIHFSKRCHNETMFFRTQLYTIRGLNMAILEECVGAIQPCIVIILIIYFTLSAIIHIEMGI